MLRERSYRQLVARQCRPGQENSWRFRVDLAKSVSRLCRLDKPLEGTVLRERSYRQLVARQCRPGQENSWRFRVDLAKSVSRLCRLDKGSSRDARRFLRPAMAWQ